MYFTFKKAYLSVAVLHESILEPDHFADFDKLALELSGLIRPDDANLLKFLQDGDKGIDLRFP